MRLIEGTPTERLRTENARPSGINTLGSIQRNEKIAESWTGSIPRSPTTAPRRPSPDAHCINSSAVLSHVLRRKRSLYRIVAPASLKDVYRAIRPAMSEKPSACGKLV